MLIEMVLEEIKEQGKQQSSSRILVVDTSK